MSRALVFVLGVGAWKSGMAWPYELLSRQPGADFGTIKVYHVLYRIHWPARLPFAWSVIQRLRRTNLRPVRLSGLKSVDLRSYARSFRGVIDNFGPHITGDITPDHSTVWASTVSVLVGCRDLPSASYNLLP